MTLWTSRETTTAELGVIGARAQAGWLLGWDVGTSYAAPLIIWVTAAVAAHFPDFTAELIRALVIVSVEETTYKGNTYNNIIVCKTTKKDVKKLFLSLVYRVR